MAAISVKTAMALFLGSLLATAATTSSPPKYELGDSIPLGDEDLREITARVLRDNPMLASSPGIKYAEAQRSRDTIDMAFVIFHPHSDSAGIKQAYQVHCTRKALNETWDCNPAEIRRYVTLESQEFEVRVKGDLGSEEIFALIEATRETAASTATDDSSVLETATILLPYDDSYIVVWGTPEGYGNLSVQAWLRPGGDAANPEDWTAQIYEPPE